MRSIVRAEPAAAADGGRDVGFEEFLVVQRGRRGRAWLFGVLERV
jgi:hypothetical protein